NDGRALVVGYEDGAVQMFLIVDRFEQKTITYLKEWRRQQLESIVEPVQQEIIDKQPE
ncbi:unnamed protein product, partial [Rotaria sp. Silwood1]